MSDFFDATNIAPQQGQAKHPPGMFPASISNTGVRPTKDNTGGRFVIEFTTPAGRIEKGYNLWNQSEKAVEIAQKELACVCHATGVFRLSGFSSPGPMTGAELRGARLNIEINWQSGQEPSAEKPAGGFTEVVRVFDTQGNEPGKTGAAPAQQAPQAASAATGWQQPAAQPQQPPVQQQQPAPQGWAAPQQQAAPAPAAGWSQQPQGAAPAAAAPPWGQAR